MYHKLSLFLLVSLPIFFVVCGCQDDRVPHLEERVSRIESELKGLKKTPRSIPTVASQASSGAVSSTPLNSSRNSAPVIESVYHFTGDEKDDPFIGKKDGEILMMAFIDYESRASRRFINVTLPELKKEFKDSTNRWLILRDYPLPNHSSGMSAAIYAQCAGEQGHYWDAFYKITEAPLEDLAKTLDEVPAGVDAQKHKKCRASNRYKSEIEKDQRDGQGLGTQGSPSFFIGRCARSVCNGQFIRGAQPLGLFRKIISEVENQQALGK